MKKFIAVVCALTLSCAMFASCGKKDSKKDDSSKSVTTDAETSEKADSSEADKDEGENTLTKAYCDSLEARKFKIKMSTTSDNGDDSVATVEMNGDNYCLSIGEGEMKTDLYVIDGVTYVLKYADKTYSKQEHLDSLLMSIKPTDYAMGIEEGYKFISSETTDDGLICETYYAPDLFSGEIPTNAEDGNVTEYKYYFKPDGTYPEKVVMSAYGMVQTTIFESFTLDAGEIVLPDLEGWTDDTEAEASTSVEGDPAFDESESAPIE